MSANRVSLFCSMTATAKYERTANSPDAPSRAIHRRLRREVELHRIEPQDSLHIDSIKELAAKLSKLDHPGVPHLLDFFATDTEYYIVTEAFEHSSSLVFDETLETLAALDRISDALSHAHQRDVAHGELTVDCISYDAQQTPRIRGLGFQQANEPRVSVDELKTNDLLELKSLLLRSLRQWETATAGDNGITEEAMHELREILLRQHTSVAQFHAEFHPWMRAIQTAIEAKRLTIAPSKSVISATSRSRQFAVAVAVAVVMSVVAVGLTVYLWPASSPTIAQVERRGGELASESKANLPKGNQDREEVQSTIDTHSSSLPGLDLANAGINRKDDAVRRTDANNQKPPRSPETPGIETPETPKPKATKPKTGKAKPKPKPKSVKPKRKRPDNSKPAKRSQVNPFASASSQCDLPDISELQTVSLVAAKLGTNELNVKLLGGEWAVPSGEFRERKTSDNEWTISMSTKGKKVDIAKIRSSPTKVNFTWLPEASSARGAAYLSNTILQLKSGKWEHMLAMRTPLLRDPIKPRLSGTESISLAIPNPPVPGEMFVEFQPADQSPADARPQSISMRSDQQMSIPLDHGTESLVKATLKPQGRGKLRMRVQVRPTEMSPFRPVNKRFEREALRDLQSLRVQIANMKQQVKHIEGKNKTETKKLVKLAEASIRLRENQLKAAEEFAAAWTVARDSQLSFHVFRKVGKQRLELARFE